MTRTITDSNGSCQLPEVIDDEVILSSMKIARLEFAKRLAEICTDMEKRPHGRQAFLARLLKISQPAVKKWLDAESMPDIDKAIALAKWSGTHFEWLMTGRGEKFLDKSRELFQLSHVANDSLPVLYIRNTEPGPDIKGRIPLISEVQAGMWTEAVDVYEPGYAEQWLPIFKSNGENTFALRVVGDSMTSRYGKTYPEGCIIVVNPDLRSPNNGDRIVAKLTGSESVTFKVFTQEAGRQWLRALNDSYPPIFEPFSVIGTVTGKWEYE